MKFAIIGAAGYIAPRHMKAIADNGGELIAATDPHESVGILDKFFSKCEFFPDQRDFFEFIGANPADYISICSPNYLHYEHICWSLAHANVICEKPLVLDWLDLETVRRSEKQHNRRVWAILQARLHSEATLLKQVVGQSYTEFHSGHVEYVAPRGRWYRNTWKGSFAKSGGIGINIGIHLFDLLIWVFGEPNEWRVHKCTEQEIKGMISFGHADITFRLATEGEPVRKITLGSWTYDLSKGFEDLHSQSYAEILSGRGWGIDDVKDSIILATSLTDLPVRKPGAPQHDYSEKWMA